MFLNETNIIETLEFAGKFKYKTNIKRIKAVEGLDLNIRTIVKIVGVVKYLPTIFNYYDENIFTSPSVKISMHRWYKDCIEILKSSQIYNKKLNEHLELPVICHELDNKETIEFICDRIDSLIVMQCENYKDVTAIGMSESLNDTMCVKLTDYLQTHGYNENNKELVTYVDVYQLCRKFLIKNRLGKNIRSSMQLRLHYNKISEIIFKEEGLRLNNPSMYKFVMDFGSYNCAELKEDKLKAFVHELLTMKLKTQHYKEEPLSAAKLREKIRDFKNSLL